ncbi:MAG: hypothetical protein H6564_22240 [Lewinellaceae bacterium]|nr:hypothetical protein [Lewinellaceae bacterium]
MEEVMVLGFESRAVRFITGAVSSVSEEAFENVSVPTFQRVSYGQCPSVMTNASQVFNAESIIRIRGWVHQRGQPAAVRRRLIPPLPDDYPGVSTNRLSGSTPTILCFRQLKDAGATVIYGHANGVILDHHQKRAQLPVPVHYQLLRHFQRSAQKHTSLNGKEFRVMEPGSLTMPARTQARPRSSFFDVDTQPSTDWQELLLQKGFVQESITNTSGEVRLGTTLAALSVREDGYIRPPAGTVQPAPI